MVWSFYQIIWELQSRQSKQQRLDRYEQNSQSMNYYKHKTKQKTLGNG